ncbi:ABC transporter [Agrocybe pediades]|nr:ABC transporter [Agrocybe pediades]
MHREESKPPSSSEDAEKKVADSHPSEDVELPSTLLAGRKLGIVFSAFVLAIFLTYIDQTIISTALPTIASHFDAVSDLSWIAGGYFLPQTAFILLIGKILSISPAKPVLLVSIALFEIGSLISAVANSVQLLIFGRVVAGVGGAGLWVSVLSIMAHITTITQRPILMSIMGAVYAISAIGGPLLGGVFSDKVTWRWCFYLNLPVGGLAFVIILLVLPSIPAPEDASTVTSTTLQRWMRLDWTGSFLSICMTTMLELALQWGGNTKTWSDPAVIATLSLFGVFLISFIAWELYREEDAILPPQLFRNMSMVGACIEGFMISMCFVLASYYFPFLYQIRGHSAARSGIDILPFMISGIISCLGAGGAVTALGAPWPFLFIFPPIGAISFGLLTTVTNNTPSARILGYQILAGVGLGPAIQTVVVVVQVAFAGEKKYISQATATITFMQVLGSSVGLAASQAIFSARLRTEIDHSGVVLSPDLRALVLSNIKAVFQLEDSTRLAILRAYNVGVTQIFWLGLSACAAAVLASLLVSRKRVQPGSLTM